MLKVVSKSGCMCPAIMSSFVPRVFVNLAELPCILYVSLFTDTGDEAFIVPVGLKFTLKILVIFPTDLLSFLSNISQ